jgi:hypothetical protein
MLEVRLVDENGDAVEVKDGALTTRMSEGDLLIWSQNGALAANDTGIWIENLLQVWDLVIEELMVSLSVATRWEVHSPTDGDGSGTDFNGPFNERLGEENYPTIQVVMDETVNTQGTVIESRWAPADQELSIAKGLVIPYGRQLAVDSSGAGNAAITLRARLKHKTED